MGDGLVYVLNRFWKIDWPRNLSKTETYKLQPILTESFPSISILQGPFSTTLSTSTSTETEPPAHNSTVLYVLLFIVVAILLATTVVIGFRICAKQKRTSRTQANRDKPKNIHTSSSGGGNSSNSASDTTVTHKWPLSPFLDYDNSIYTHHAYTFSKNKAINTF